MSVEFLLLFDPRLRKLPPLLAAPLPGNWKPFGIPRPRAAALAITPLMLNVLLDRRPRFRSRPAGAAEANPPFALPPPSPVPSFRPPPAAAAVAAAAAAVAGTLDRIFLLRLPPADLDAPDPAACDVFFFSASMSSAETPEVSPPLK